MSISVRWNRLAVGIGFSSPAVVILFNSSIQSKTLADRLLHTKYSVHSRAYIKTLINFINYNMVYETSYGTGQKAFSPDLNRGNWEKPTDYIFACIGLALKLDVFDTTYYTTHDMGSK